jgi:hypothetical protein
MSLLFFEGFDSLATRTGLYQKYHNSFSTQTIDIVPFSSDTPHNHGQSFHMDGPTSSLSFFFEGVEATQVSHQSGIIGFHVKLADFSEDNYWLIALWDNDLDHQSLVYVSDSGYLEWYRSSTLLGKAETNPLSLDTWHHVECQYYTANSIPADSCILKLDGTEVLNLAAGLDTQQQSTNYTAGFSWEAALSSIRRFDNLYFLDIDSTLPNDFLNAGNGVFVEQVFPTGDGDTTDFTPSAGANWENVDEVFFDSDTTYNEATSSTSTDLFRISAPTGSVDTIYGLNMNLWANQQNMRMGKIRNISKISSTTYVHTGLFQALKENYYDIFPSWLGLNPDTDTYWTMNDLTNEQFGYKFSPIVVGDFTPYTVTTVD